MKRYIYCFFIILLLPFSINAQYQRCGTMEHLEMLIRENPELAEIMEQNEQKMQNFIHSHVERGDENETVIVIPVVVHVIWRTTQQNISEYMITSQIRVLNEDFRRMNSDAVDTPLEFQSVASDTKIEFRLADRDPMGNPHTGINRVHTDTVSWNPYDETDDVALKALSYWPSQNYLNLWVANLSSQVLGYAQFPGGPTATDGVVILYSAFGYNSPASPYNLGRTATHEVGHWVNLYHIWGDDGVSCSGSDLCNDTPNQSSEYYGCPSYPANSCNTSNMFQNYMDYTDDACMNIFTNNQAERISAAYNVARSNLNVSFKEKMEVASTGVDYIFTTPLGQPFAKLNFSSLGTADSVTVEVFPKLKPLDIPPGSKAVNRYFDIKANGTGFNAALTVYYNDAEVVGFANNDNNLELYKFEENEWTQMGGTVNTSLNTITLAGVTDFSIWAIADPNDSPIPVELTSFSSHVRGSSVELNWITATELNCNGFDIQRAEAIKENVAGEWESIGFISGKGTTTETSVYSYSDAGLEPGSYLYRLKIVDNDGSFEYSNEIYAAIEAPAVYNLSQNFPNPFNPLTSIRFQIPQKEFVTLKVHDALGVEVADLFKGEKEAGIHEISFDASSLTTGVYFYTIQAGNFVKTNKMLLLK